MVESLICRALVMAAMSGAVTVNTADLASFLNGESGANAIRNDTVPLPSAAGARGSPLGRQPKIPIRAHKEASFLKSMGAPFDSGGTMIRLTARVRPN